MLTTTAERLFDHPVYYADEKLREIQTKTKTTMKGGQGEENR